MIGCCSTPFCETALPVEGTTAQLVKGIEVECPVCGVRCTVGWKYASGGDHGGVVQKPLPAPSVVPEAERRGLDKVTPG